MEKIKQPQIQKSEIDKLFKVALDVCTDYRTKHYNDNRITFIWFTPKQLKQLITTIKTT